MSIGLIITLVGLLLFLILGYNMMLQYKIKVDAAKKHESARYVAIIDATEELIGNAHHIPFSKELLVCLNNRILDALQSMYELDPKNKALAQRVQDMQKQVKNLKDNHPNKESTSFKTPTGDKQAITMLKLVKRLRDTVRSEHNKGRFDTQSYVNENARLETMQVRINIENVIKRAKDSISRGQPGTAVQLLKKGIDVLSTRNDNYSVQSKDRLQKMLDELENNRQKTRAMEQPPEGNERDNDIDALFGEKKKW